MPSSSIYAMLKLFKTVSLQKMFPSDCITLYYVIVVVKIGGKWYGYNVFIYSVTQSYANSF